MGRLRAVIIIVAILATAACDLVMTTTRRLSPDPTGAVVARFASGEDGQTLFHIGLQALPEGRYALFAAAAPPRDRAALVSFDIDARCRLEPGSPSPAGPIRWCAAVGIFEGGVGGKAVTLEIDAATAARRDDQVRLGRADIEAIGEAPVLALVPLGSTAPSDLVVQAFSEGSGCTATTEAPTIEPLP